MILSVAICAIALLHQTVSVPSVSSNTPQKGNSPTGFFGDDDFDFFIPQIPDVEDDHKEAASHHQHDLPSTEEEWSPEAAVRRNVFLSVAANSWQNEYAHNKRFNIFLPSHPLQGKEYPLIIFFPGFQAEQPSETYEDFLGEIANKGLGAIVVAWDGTGLSNAFHPHESIDHFLPYYDMLANGTIQAFINSTFAKPARYSMNKVFIAAHSAGNRLSVLLSAIKPSLGMILIDPVDKDPLSVFPSVIVNDTINYTSPVLLMTTEFGEAKGLPFYPPCVSKGTGLKFFNAFSQSSQLYHFNVLNYGHADFLSLGSFLSWFSRVSHFCVSVKDPNAHPQQSFRDFLSGASVAFIGYYGEEIHSYSAYLVDQVASNIPVNLTMIPPRKQ